MVFLPVQGTVSFKFLILFVIERAEPANDVVFSIELLLNECKSNGNE